MTRRNDTEWSLQKSATEQVRAWEATSECIDPRITAIATAMLPGMAQVVPNIVTGYMGTPSYIAGIGKISPADATGPLHTPPHKQRPPEKPPESLQSPETKVSKQHAYIFLDKAVSAMKDRAQQRDAQGERSMAATVKAFNALTGHTLTEGEGWEFMILLKLVRGRQGGFRDDDYIDGAAYFGLLGECESTSGR
jgi:hypothetical protein